MERFATEGQALPWEGVVEARSYEQGATAGQALPRGGVSERPFFSIYPSSPSSRRFARDRAMTPSHGGREGLSRMLVASGGLERHA